MVRNLGVKETRCPPCRSDFSEVQLCATPRQQGAIIIQLVGVQGYVKLRCKISSQSLSLSLSFFHRKNPPLPLFSCINIYPWKRCISQRFEEHVSPSNSCPAKRERSFRGRAAKVSSFFFQGQLENPFERLPPFEDRSAVISKTVRKVSIAGVWPFLRGGRESEGRRVEKSRVISLGKKKNPRKLFATAFLISQTRSPFAVYFHVSRFLHLWFRDTKWKEREKGQIERLNRQNRRLCQGDFSR